MKHLKTALCLIFLGLSMALFSGKISDKELDKEFDELFKKILEGQKRIKKLFDAPYWHVVRNEIVLLNLDKKTSRKETATLIQAFTRGYLARKAYKKKQNSFPSYLIKDFFK